MVEKTAEAKATQSQSREVEAKVATSTMKQLEFDFDSLLDDQCLSTKSIKEVYTIRTKLDDATITDGRIHLLGRDDHTINMIPYDNALGKKQVELMKLIGPGEIAIAIKHHMYKQDSNIKEQLKLQCTHIEVVVGVEGGVITINNPQNYQGGLFGEDDYPMTFIKPVLNSPLSNELEAEYFDNVRTWLIIANCFTQFPDGNYNGGDPLNAYTLERIEVFGDMLLSALIGDEEAINWLNQPGNKIYCAELAFLSFNLGLYFPLNKKHIGAYRFNKVKEALLSKDFVRENKNPYAKEVDLTLSPENLNPLESSNEESVSGFWDGLAITPLKMDDMILNAVKYSVDRERVGEEVGSKQQLELFKRLRPEIMALVEGDPEGFIVLLDGVEEILGTVWSSYNEFLENMKRFIEAGSNIGDKINKMFIPPHAFLIRSSESIVDKENRDKISWKYLGHGAHRKYFKEKI